MTREEAIAILDGFKHNPLFNGQHFEALDMAISALKGEWIPVSERLPEKDGQYLVTYDREDEIKVNISYFDRHGFWIGDVIAWQPLPEPYKAESEDKE